jgi:hypothetical protein
MHTDGAANCLPVIVQCKQQGIKSHPASQQSGIVSPKKNDGLYFTPGI